MTKAWRAGMPAQLAKDHTIEELMIAVSLKLAEKHLTEHAALRSVSDEMNRAALFGVWVAVEGERARLAEAGKTGQVLSTRRICMRLFGAQSEAARRDYNRAVRAIRENPRALLPPALPVEIGHGA